MMENIDVRSFLQKLPSGNFYLPVAARIYIATKKYGERLCIRTQLVHHDGERGEYIVSAEVLLYPSSNGDKPRLHATGYGRCTDKQFAKGALMKAESAAVGRALRAFGIGTEYALEDEEDDSITTGQLADAPARAAQPDSEESPKARTRRLALALEPDMNVGEVLKKYIPPDLQERFRSEEASWDDLANHLQELLDAKTKESS